MSDELGVGITLYGYCEGVWGSWRSGNHIVIAMGPDWLVAKNTNSNTYVLAQGGDLEILARHTKPDPEEDY